MAAGCTAAQSVLVAGKPADSELYRRITSTDPSEHMPPAKSHKQLTAQHIDLIRRWIEQGARYQAHWSLIPPVRTPPPAVRAARWVRNPIDQFVLARLEADKLAPSPEADRRTLLRRLSFDLTGLPPTYAEVTSFLQDKGPEAYEAAVERLLNSPHFGERMAMWWLDLVRFADTCGYHSDNHRDVWLYRDWVIKSFNNNMPLDKFTVEQLAGDLLPNPTAEMKIASGYNRLLQTTEEGGAQAKEYQAKYYADRVRNLSTVWMGMTLGCTECHDHKFDPFLTKEFYQLEAFFADIQENSVGRQQQTPIFEPQQLLRLKKFDSGINGLQKVLATSTPGARRGPGTLGSRGARPEQQGRAPGNPRSAGGGRQENHAAQQQKLGTYYRSHVAPSLAEQRSRLAVLQKDKAELLKTVPTSLITMAGGPRTIHVLKRGNWLDESGPIVTPQVPASLPGLNVGKRRPNRLDLARWLTARDHPLTARIVVNRLWALYFGQGICKTLDDFGAAGGLADSSRAARLAGGRIRGKRLEHAARDQAHAPVQCLPANGSGRSEPATGRPLQPAGGTAGPVSAGCGNGSR